MKKSKKISAEILTTVWSFLLILTFSSQAVLLISAQKTSAGLDFKDNAAMTKNGIDHNATDISQLPVTNYGLFPGFKSEETSSIAPLAFAAEFYEPLRANNSTAATATPFTGAENRITGNLYPNGDVDYYSFQANAGDRIYAAMMTSFSAGNSTDSQLSLIASDGTTLIEFDDDNGTFASLSSTIAGARIPTTGTYYLKVNDFTAGTTSERPYELWFARKSAAPTPEIESNDTPATANPIPASGLVSGARNPAAATEQDWYSMTLSAGDTVFLSLDLDPERDNVTWNGRLGIAQFGDANNQILVIDDAGTGDVTPNPNLPSEALFMTVKNSGTYYAFVDSASAAVGGPTATYNLNVTVLPKIPIGVNCTTYTSTNAAQAIGPGNALTSSTITVPGNPRIADIDVSIQLNHALMQDVDAHLRSPAGNNNGLFTDIGAAATGGQQQMDVVFDDQAGIPPSFTVLKGIHHKPENNSTAGTASTSGAYRLSWFNGENAGGTWTLDLRDDTDNGNGGTLTGWSLRICEQPPLPGSIVFEQNFESGAGGFTHSGAQDEWELGLPSTAATTTTNPIAAFTTCASGVNCWKTDLDNTYNAGSNQDLFSPDLVLTPYMGQLTLEWAMRHQIETANFDHAYVEVQDVNNAANNRIVWDWTEPTPISASNGTGNPQMNIGGSAGWGNYRADISDFAGKTVRLRFHLDSDTSVQFGGMAIDDVRVANLAPTAANSEISGRVTNADGIGLSRAIVILTAANGERRTALTNAFGYYRFESIESAQTYVLNASRKGYTFTPRVITPQQDITDANLIANE